MIRTLLFFFTFLLSATVHATEPFTVFVTPEWEDTPHTYEVFPGKTVEILRFEGADYAPKHPSLPSFVHKFPLSSDGTLTVTIENAQYERIDKKAHEDDVFIVENIRIDARVDMARGRAMGTIEFVPLRRVGSGLERLVSGELHIKHNEGANVLKNGAPDNTTASKLSSGEIYKIAVSTAGVHKIDANFLTNELGLSLSDIDPARIQLLGNGGTPLPEIVGDFREDDVYENTIYISSGDGNFSSNDFILFYATGPDPTTYNEGTETFSVTKNLYSDKSYYFLKINASENGKRIVNQASMNGANYSTDSYDAVIHLEEEKMNLLDYFQSTHPSGRQWFGDQFKFVDEKEYDFSFENLITSEPVQVRSQLAGRSVNDGTHRFTISHNGSTITTANMSNIGGGGTSPFAAIRTANGTFNATSDDITLKLDYTRPTSAEAWLDYITLQARCALRYTGNSLIVRDSRSIGQPISNFTINNANNNIEIWNVTNALDPVRQNYNINGAELTFGAATETLQTFVVFEDNKLAAPVFVEKIQHQNLHGITKSPDMLIIYAPELEPAVNRYIDHRTSHSGMTIEAVPVYQIYNEFGSGSPDVTAIRDFVKMLYSRSNSMDSLRYLLMFGDGVFDHKNNNGDNDYVDLVPVYETRESVNPITSYPSDDYFALMDDNEGNIAGGLLDIGAGRFPVQNLTEAELMVDKIIRYDTDATCFGDWRNRVLFNADDEDNNLHFRDADTVAARLGRAYSDLNINKIYFDAYQQIPSPQGNRFPRATEAINNNMFKGNLVVNYTGHGGSNGWAQEFVLRQDDMDSWTNANKLPLFVTATCEFAPYDDRDNNTAGEQIVLNPNGGAIATFTTVRAVYANANFQLSKAVFSNLFKPVNGVIPTIGEILRVAKNTSSASVENSRKFALLGDPSMKLARPQYEIATTKINNQTISETDTVRALEEMTVEGFVKNPNGGILTDFNGILYPTVYDKVQIVTTIGNDGGSPQAQFKLQQNVIFKGRVSVTNGEFKFTFVVPSDIDFSFGNGKISYYADDGTSRDAAGAYEDFVIGGSADGITDEQPPVVEVFMNDDGFAFGGITDANPTLLVKLSDDLGINTAGAGIGHDLTGNVDDNTSQTYILNDFYESELDNPRKGEVRYPLTNIPEGRHTVKVKAWDVSNNSAEGYTEFVVARNAEIALAHVLNYPNPFTTHTSFEFEHNFAGQPIDVMVQIFTVSGQLVKTIEENITPTGYRVKGIDWDGTDDFGERIGRGVYVYRISIQADTGEQVRAKSEFEKLVILR